MVSYRYVCRIGNVFTYNAGQKVETCCFLALKHHELGTISHCSRAWPIISLYVVITIAICVCKQLVCGINYYLCTTSVKMLNGEVREICSIFYDVSSSLFINLSVRTTTVTCLRSRPCPANLNSFKHNL